MRRIVVVILFIVAFISVGYYFYQKEFQKNANIQELVPADAFLFYNSNTPLADWNTIRKSSLGIFLDDFDWYENRKTQINSLVELIPEEFQMYFSSHKVGKGDFDNVFYFNTNISDIEELIQIISEKEKWEVDKRKLDDTQIIEYSSKGESVLNFCELKGWLIVSNNPFLVEEVIKNTGQIALNTNSKWTVFPDNLKSFLKDFTSLNLNVMDLGDNPIEFNLSFQNNGLILTGQSIENNKAITSSLNLVDYFDYIPMNATIIQKRNDEVNVELHDGKMMLLKSQTNSVNNDTLLVSGQMYSIYMEGEKFEYVFDDKLLVEVNDKQTLIEIIDNVNKEEVWGKSIRMSEKINKISSDAQEVWLMNVGRNISLINENIKNDFLSDITKFRPIELLSLQKTQNGTNILFEFGLEFEEKNNQEIKMISNSKPVEETLLYKHNVSISTKPYLVKNHLDGSSEYVFQDSLNNLCLIGSNNELLYSRTLDDKIITDIYQVDAYRNGKLQYLVATNSYLYLIDRNGNDVEGYPKKYENIDWISVFDYDNNRKYRFVVAQKSRNITFQNPSGEKLAPWNPKVMEQQMVNVPQHVRIENKDIIVAVTKDSKIHCFNRRGEYYKGFPIQPNINDVISYRIVNSNLMSKSFIELLSSKGEAIIVNFKGEISELKKLETDVAGDFNFTIFNGDYVYEVSEASSTFYNSEGKVLAESFDEISQVQFYNFGVDQQVLYYTNQKGEGSLISNGKLLTEIKSSQKISCLYSSAKEEMTVISADKNNLIKITLPY